MSNSEAILFLETIKRACEKAEGLEEEAEAVAMAIDMMKEHEQHRRSWEEILEEGRIDG